MNKVTYKFQKVFHDIGFIATAKMEVENGHCYVVEYTLYEIKYIDLENIYLNSKNDPNDFFGVTDITKAEVFAHGEVKWDGCSNWEFDIDNKVMMHACYREQLINVGLALVECWDWTKELLPYFDGY